VNAEVELPDCLEAYCVAVTLVGSRVTCSPPPTDTDQDVLCYVSEEAWPDLLFDLELLGWEFDGCEHYANALNEGVGFRSYRNGELNLVLTTDKEFHRRFLAATSIAKRFNLLEKDDRIALFQAVLYGNACGPTWDELLSGDAS
jgi:hypothetical protein